MRGPTYVFQVAEELPAACVQEGRRVHHRTRRRGVLARQPGAGVGRSRGPGQVSGPRAPGAAGRLRVRRPADRHVPLRERGAAVAAVQRRQLGRARVGRPEAGGRPARRAHRVHGHARRVPGRGPARVPVQGPRRPAGHTGAVALLEGGARRGGRQRRGVRRAQRSGRGRRPGQSGPESVRRHGRVRPRPVGGVQAGRRQRPDVLLRGRRPPQDHPHRPVDPRNRVATAVLTSSAIPSSFPYTRPSRHPGRVASHPRFCVSPPLIGF